MFSALYDMLPSAKKYLIKSGYSTSKASWLLLGGFLGGIVGIQIISRVLHLWIPHHAVDCDHSHEDGKAPSGHDHSHVHNHDHTHSHTHAPAEQSERASEATPLIPPEGQIPKRSTTFKLSGDGAKDRRWSTYSRRPSMMEIPSRVMSFVKDRPAKPNCDSTGPCFGFSDPCGQECFKHVAAKGPGSRIRAATGFSYRSSRPETVNEESERDTRTHSPIVSPLVTRTHSEADLTEMGSTPEEDLEAQHHHHVSENEFMSIGLQTSIAIALHKLPEGFITYATNHANPNLGFSVFLALLVHNISEGFAMALPLYLALGSRFRAMFWSSLLGGVSQPLGAGLAAAWFKLAGSKDHKPGTLVYGCMFAITAGIMTSVALSLFTESLSLNHNRNLCIAFAFLGMALMGVSNALTSD